MKVNDLKVNDFKMNDIKMKKRFGIIDFLKSKAKPKHSSVKDRIANHQPSWMYRNE